jgi:hypothetical protein
MWYQFNFICSQSLRRLHPSSEYYDRLFRFKKGLLLTLDKNGINYFLLLDEGDYFLLRVEVNNETAESLKKEFDGLVGGSPDFDDVTVTNWLPEDDAKKRILDARERSKQRGISFQGIPEGGWKIEAWDGAQWVAKLDDLEMKADKFARFMSKVAGKFTRAYLEEISERVDDRWLLSVFIHLLLHSVSEQRFEEETRAFPWI